MSVVPFRAENTPAVDAERQVLGAIILGGAGILEDLDVQGNEFYDPRHEQLFTLLAQMHADNKPIDLVSVGQELAAKPIRGLPVAFTAEIMGEVTTTANAGHHAQAIRDAASRRRVAVVANRMQQRAAQHGDASQIIEDARAELDAAAGSLRSGVELVSMADVLDEAIDEITNPGALYPTLWPSLNHLIGGWAPGRVYVIGARPGSGKTIIGVNAAIGMTQRHTCEVAISSLEMGRRELTQRTISALAGVNFKLLKENNLSEDDWRRVALARGQIESLPKCFIDDNPSIRPVDVRAHARAVARRGNLGMVVVDYLQLMESGEASENRQQEVARFSRQMKLIARDLDVPVVVLSQLNRGPEGREGGPRLSDLRDSGAVEQDADVVILLHRDEKTEPDTLHVAVGKNRQGPKGGFALAWEGHYMRVVEPTWSPS